VAVGNLQPDPEPDAASVTVSDQFRKAARLFSDRIAVRTVGCDSGSEGILTYGELAHRVEALAGRILDAGVVPGESVAVHVADPVGRITALLAALCSGSVYVAIDPDSPPDRLKLLLADADVRVAVSEGPPEDLPDSTRVVPLNGAVSTRLLPRVYPDQPAYVVYTSGTTGGPKGVLVSHRALAQHISAVIGRFGIGDHDTVLNFARPWVDVFLEQVLTALTTGASLVVPDRTLLSPDQLLALLDDECVTVANLPAAYGSALQAASV